jgi:hypothetical protein
MTDIDPSIVSDYINHLRGRAAVCNALLGGTTGMRTAGTVYLPQEPAESNDAYSARLSKTVLFPAYEKALNTMVGKPFEDPITFEDDVPQAIKDACENIDRSGRDLDEFSSDTFEQTLNDGHGWLVVDCPKVNPGLTLADERALGVAPYLIHVPLSNCLGMRHVVENGVKRMTMFRYEECVENPVGMFGTEMVTRVRVLEPGMVTVYQKDDKGKWAMLPELSGPVTLQEMPVVCIKLHKTPPLENLAWLNVEHWQSRSDQRHILHTARVPLLFGKDIDQGTDGAVIVGPNRLIKGSGPNTDLKWVELMGGSIEAGRQDLLDIEDAMRRTAGELLSGKVQKTATETNKESGEGESQLKKWVHTFEDCMEEAFRLMAAWIGEAKGGGICINTDWDDADLQADMLTAITNLHNAGLISKDSVIYKLKESDMIPEDRTVQQEKDLIANEAPDMGTGSGDPMLSANDRMMARSKATADAKAKVDAMGAA